MAAVGITGLTEVQHQQVIAARYLAPGVLTGCAVTGRSDAMSYNIAAGVAVVGSGTGRMVEAVVPAVTVATLAAPATGSRTDYVVVNSAGVVSVKQAAPTATETLLRRVIVPAGISSTSAAQFTADVVAAIRPGQNLGRLVEQVDGASPGVAAVTAEIDWLIGTIPALPVRRRVRVLITQMLWASSPGGMDYTVMMGGAALAVVPMAYGLSVAREPSQSEFTMLIGPGQARQVTVRRKHAWGNASPTHFWSGSTSARFEIFDLGEA